MLSMCEEHTHKTNRDCSPYLVGFHSRNTRYATHVSASTKSFVAFASILQPRLPRQDRKQTEFQQSLAKSGLGPCTVTVQLTVSRTKQHQWLSGVQEHSDKHALEHYSKAQCAFKILMIHEVLQFALRIAFRCVLHRCGIQDIHC